MNAHRIEVLDRADDDAIVIAVADDLHLELFPADDRLFEQNFRRRRHLEAVRDDAFELLEVVRNAAARAAQREGRTDDGREADRMLLLERLFERMRDVGPGTFQTDLGHGLPEQVAILRHVDGFPRGRDHLDVVLLQHAFAREIQRAIEARLPAHCRQQRVGPLLLDDSLDGRPVDRLDVDGIGHVRVGHDRRRVGVHEDDPEALFAQRLAGLGAGIVEFAGLADDDRAGSNDQNAVQVCAFRHVGVVRTL